MQVDLEPNAAAAVATSAPVVLLVSNISVEPFRLVHPGFAAAVRDEPPSQAWWSALRARADLAVIPVAKAHAVAAVLEPIGDFGVACKGPVRSVLLFGNCPLAELVTQRKPIYLTPQSETSRRLLRLLCLREFGLEPVFSQDLNGADGCLCIGDEALRRCQDTQGLPVVADLCEWWFAQTGMPFVFARWMVRRSASEALKRAALDWLSLCVEAAGKPVELLVAEGYNHFEIAETLGNPYGVLGRAALALMGIGPGGVQ